MDSCSGTGTLALFGARNSSRIICRVSGISSKGTTISTDGGTTHDVTATQSIKTIGFTISAFLEDEGAHIDEQPDFASPCWQFRNKGVSYDSGSGKWGIEGEPTWFNGITTTFWCWDNATQSLISSGNVAISDYETTRGTKPGCLYFSYNLPASTAATTKTDADNQHDIIFAHNGELRTFDEGGSIVSSASSGSRTDEYVDIVFYHALSEILFTVSPDDGTFDKSIKIVDISFDNVYTSGSSIFDNSKTTVDAKFAWTPGSSKASYAQTYNADFSSFENAASAPDSLGEWRKESYSQESETYVLYTSDNKFFMIPQELPADAQLTVTFEKDGVQTTKSADITGDTWRAGKYYKYKLNYSDSGEEMKFSLSLVDWNSIPVDLVF